MIAVEIDDYGDADGLKLVEREQPQITADQVLVKVKATTFNPIDIKRAAGVMKQIFPLHFPWIPGGDLSGVVEAVGEDVRAFKVGDEVYGDAEEGGTYADYVAIAADKVAIKPKGLSHAEAASLGLVAQTAKQAIERADLKAGQTVVIQGAGGAVGSAAVQLAARSGSTVAAIASQSDADRLLEYGAAIVIDRDATFEQSIADVDVVIDTVGGPLQARLLGLLKKGGILISLTQPPSQEAAAQHGVRAEMLHTRPNKADLDFLRGIIDAGELRPFLGPRYTLADAAKVWKDYKTGGIKGKIVIEVDPAEAD